MTDLLAHYGITYRDADHRYERFGVKLDSVSSVLPYLAQNEFLAAHPERIEKAGGRGIALATYIELIESGKQVMTMPNLSDSASVEFCKVANSFTKFKLETGFTALTSPAGDIASELFVYHDMLDYIGRLDLAGYAPNTNLKGPGLIEVKATAVLPKTVGPQSAAYFEAFNRCAKFYDLPKLKWRASLHLTAKGYRFHPLTDPLDFPRFCSVLTTVRWARELGLEIQWAEINKAVSPVGDAPLPSEVFT